MRRSGRTSTSSDPLISTYFAIECSNHGSGVVHIADRWALQTVQIVPNVLADRECEVALRILPEDFAKRARWTIPAQQAADILRAMGFAMSPVIASYAALTLAINLSPRLGDEQIQEFIAGVTRLFP